MLVTGKPVKNSAIATGLGQPEQKPRNVQLRNGTHKACQHRYDSPANENPSDPDSRSNLMQHQIARDLKQKIAEKENTNQQSKLLAGDGQLLVHRQRGKPNIDPVEIGDDIQEKKIRQNSEA